MFKSFKALNSETFIKTSNRFYVRQDFDKKNSILDDMQADQILDDTQSNQTLDDIESDHNIDVIHSNKTLDGTSAYNSPFDTQTKQTPGDTTVDNQIKWPTIWYMSPGTKAKQIANRLTFQTQHQSINHTQVTNTPFLRTHTK